MRCGRYYAPGEGTGGTTHGVGWGARNYHNGNGVGPPKRAGEQTDYGDYSLLLAEHLAATAESAPSAMDLAALLPRWRKAMSSWRSWMCTQTKQALQKLAQGYPADRLGGPSNAMAVRSAAAIAFWADEELAADAAHKAMFTHAEPTAHAGAEFFTRVAFRVANDGLDPVAAIQGVADDMGNSFIRKKVELALTKAKEAADPTSELAQAGELADDRAITSMGRLWEVGKSEPIKGMCALSAAALSAAPRRNETKLLCAVTKKITQAAMPGCARVLGG